MSVRSLGLPGLSRSEQTVCGSATLEYSERLDERS